MKTPVKLRPIILIDHLAERSEYISPPYILLTAIAIIRKDKKVFVSSVISSIKGQTLLAYVWAKAPATGL